MENLRVVLSAIYRHKEQELQNMSDEGAIDFAILDCEIDDVDSALQLIDAEMDIDDKLNGLEGIKNTTTSGSLYDALNKYLDSVICLETYGTYLEGTDIQHIKVVAVDRKWLEGYCQDKWDSAVDEFLSEYTWDHTDGIDRLASEENGLVGVCER